MNFLGMGSVEIVVVLLVAFIVLGPRRMTDAARLLGKATREVRRLTESLPQMMLDEEEPPQVPTGRRAPRRPEQDEEREGDSGAAADGPVAFRKAAEPDPPTSLREGSDGDWPDGGAGPERGAQ